MHRPDIRLRRVAATAVGPLPWKPGSPVVLLFHDDKNLCHSLKTHTCDTPYAINAIPNLPIWIEIKTVHEKLNDPLLYGHLATMTSGSTASPSSEHVFQITSCRYVITLHFFFHFFLRDGHRLGRTLAASLLELKLLQDLFLLCKCARYLSVHSRYFIP